MQLLIVIPGNTATTILFYNHFQTFDFSWISVLDFGQLKNPSFYTEVQPF